MESKLKLLSSVGGDATGLLEKLKQTRDLEKKELLRRIKLAGGPEKFLAQRYPNLSRLAQDSVSESDLARYPEQELKDAERRLVGCAKCQLGSAVCSTDRVGHRRGQQPRWENGRLVFSSCANWPEYELRSRIVTSGVPKRFADCGIREFAEALDEESRHAVAQFVRQCVEDQPVALVVGGVFSLQVSVGVLRAIAQRRDDVSFRFVRAPTLVAPLKSYYGDSKGNTNPLAAPNEEDVFVITGLSPDTDSDWFTGVIRELVSGRYYEEKTTLIAVDDSDGLDRFGPMYFGNEVPVCVTRRPKR